MSQATIRTAVYNAVNGVTDIGKVYDFEKWSASWDEFLDQFKTTIGGVDQVRGWMVAYRGYANPPEMIAAGPPGAASFLTTRPHRFSITGFMGLNDDDATEKTFAALVESVVAALDADSTLHDTNTYMECAPASIDTFETLMMAGLLTNYVEIGIVVTEAAEI